MTDPRIEAVTKAMIRQPITLTVNQMLAAADAVDPVRAEVAELRRQLDATQAEVERLQGEWDRLNDMRIDEMNRAHAAEARLAAVTALHQRMIKAQEARWRGVTAVDDHVPIWHQDSRDLSAMLAAVAAAGSGNTNQEDNSE